MRKLENKTAMITGCNRGFGNKIMCLFASEGANVIACCRVENDEFETQIKELATKYNVSIYPIYFDLVDQSAIKEGIKEIKALKVSVDILVNNAGIGHLAILPFTRMSDVHNVFQINYFAQLQIVQGMYNLISKSHGCIINMASIAGIDGDAGNAVYGATKACMILLTKVLSKELANAGVRVNAIAPGLSETDFAEIMGEKAKESMINSAMFHRLGKPEEIAKAALFLASDDASFVTGQIIRVDGGKI